MSRAKAQLRAWEAWASMAVRTTPVADISLLVPTMTIIIRDLCASKFRAGESVRSWILFSLPFELNRNVAMQSSLAAVA